MIVSVHVIAILKIVIEAHVTNVPLQIRGKKN